MFEPAITVIEAFAPYRISPVGAHTDHQAGRTCGFTLREGVHFRGAATGDGSIEVNSADFAGAWRSSVLAPAPLRGAWCATAPDTWTSYAEGIRGALAMDFPLKRGLRGRLHGDLPSGGIASSAALQVVVLRALLAANDFRIADPDAVRLVRDSERSVTGTPVGLLDPSVILHGQARTLVVIDCADGTVRLHRFAARFPPHEWWLLDVGVRRELPATPYARRVQECTEAARLLGAPPENPVLGAVGVEALRRLRSTLPPVLAQRAEHVLSEIKRVRLAVNAVANADLPTLAALINASAESLVRFFDVGVPQTVIGLRSVREVEGVLASTFAGGGFGGHLVLLTQPGSEPQLRAFAAAHGFRLHAVHPF